MYTYKEFLNLNNPNLGGLDVDLSKFFLTIAESNGQNHLHKETRNNYPNKNNIYFNNKKRTRIIKIKSSDPEILQKIRAILGKVSPSTINIMQDNIIELLETHPHNWQSVAELFFANIIDSASAIDVYSRLLVKLEEKFPLLIHHLHQLSLKQAREPKKFDQDTCLETAIHRTSRWGISNAIYIVELFHRGKYSREYLNQTIKHWLDTTTPENTLSLEIVVKILPKLKKNNLNTEILEKLTQISENKSYPGRLRFLAEVK